MLAVCGCFLFACQNELSVESVASDQGGSSPVIGQPIEGGGTSFDFSENPIEDELYIYSEAPGQEPIEEVVVFKRKKVVAASCLGQGSCLVGASTGEGQIHRVVFDDGTSITF